MKQVGELLKLLKNYKSWVIAHSISNVLAAIFTILSLPIVMPLFEIFFNKDNAVIIQKPDSFSLTEINNYFQYYLQDWIYSSPNYNDQILKICGLIIGLFFFKNLFQYLALFFMAPVRNGIIRDLRQNIFKKLTDLPILYFSDEKKGDIMSRVSADVQEVEWSILTTLEKIIRDPIILIGAIGFMLVTSVKLTLIVFGILALTGIVIGGIGKQLRKQSGDVQASLGRILVYVEETISGLKIIKAFNAERTLEQRFGEENNFFKKSLTGLLWKKDLASPLSEFLGIIAVCVLFIFGAKMVFNNQISRPEFFTYLLAFFYTINPAKAIATAYSNLQKGLAALNRVHEITDQKNAIKLNSGDQKITEFKNNIVFKNVDFSYTTDDQLVLKNINLTIQKGQTIALVGESGSGKSTITELLLRFYDVTNGQILLDGQDIRNFPPSETRSLFGLVSQEPILFNTTIWENISFGTNITDITKIKAAATLAQAHDFIEELPDKYNSITGDRGQKLSGGQKQRIALARAILADPPILILDEATSALDSASELLVQKALDIVLKDRTSIIVAHRLSTIQKADVIVVLKSGKIIESGAHSNLIQKEGEYNKFVNLQRM